MIITLEDEIDEDNSCLLHHTTLHTTRQRRYRVHADIYNSSKLTCFSRVPSRTSRLLLLLSRFTRVVMVRDPITPSTFSLSAYKYVCLMVDISMSVIC